MKLPSFEYACPATLKEAVALLASHQGEAKALAGGQSLMPMMAFRVAQPTLLGDLRKLSDLRGIKIGPDGVRLGALGRGRDILDDKRLDLAHPLLKPAISHVAHYKIRNRGTVGWVGRGRVGRERGPRKRGQSRSARPGPLRASRRTIFTPVRPIGGR